MAKLLTFAVLLFLLVGCQDPAEVANMNAEHAAIDQTEREIPPLSAAESFVKDKLLSPGSMKGPLPGDSGVEVKEAKPGIWDINSYVDSQNGFGALLRTHYIATVKDNGNGTWTLVSLTLLDTGT